MKLSIGPLTFGDVTWVKVLFLVSFGAGAHFDKVDNMEVGVGVDDVRTMLDAAKFDLKDFVLVGCAS
jgi:hypothetical protein